MMHWRSWVIGRNVGGGTCEGRCRGTGDRQTVEAAYRSDRGIIVPDIRITEGRPINAIFVHV